MDVCVVLWEDGIDKIVGSIMSSIDGHDWKNKNIHDTLSVVIILFVDVIRITKDR